MAKGTLRVDIVVVSPVTPLPALDSSLRALEDTVGGLLVVPTELLRVDTSEVDCGGSDNDGVVLGSRLITVPDTELSTPVAVSMSGLEPGVIGS